ncbi:MAG: hypothetical protein KatS3mg088_158 [Patescibacteria group bacterium]|nr:MAG: hypothetical protein KatS3mg088_158 [Patescibacteria group bacterium]
MIDRFKLMIKILIAISLLFLISFFVVGYFWPPKAGLLVVSEPKADVFIDGLKVGETPYDQALKPKEVVVKIVPNDPRLVSYETKIKLIPKVKTILQRDLGETEEKSAGILVSFEKVAGKESIISVISDPDKSQVIIDGQVRGFTPFQSSSVKPGQHKISIIQPDFITKDINIRVYPGYKLTAFVKLAPITVREVEAQNSNDKIFPFKIQISNVGRDYLKIREKPDLMTKEIGRIKEGDVCDVFEEDGNKEWYRITCQDKEGWIPSSYAKAI